MFYNKTIHFGAVIGSICQQRFLDGSFASTTVQSVNKANI